MPGGKPRLGRTPMSVRLTPQARSMLGDEPSARATEVLEQWARARALSVTREEVEALMGVCASQGDGEGVELCGRALASDEGSVDWCRAAALVIGLRGCGK